ncbi:ParB N-terminal domain-containing protein [Clostridium estertheticum]|uniref:CD3324 family protein n=1 Tax=Clostridium estertheticum TaxID=238834 RepID=UPI0013E98286|nr:CD3324 family protein [Clostridium estertheticum]MBZ9689334.1 ParB N-terminal domain-containing protein [Clostridium estertheticum]
MKYENGEDIFPEQLLRQIQKYVSGKLVYIPSGAKRREWGETSGYKQYLLERNRNILNKFNDGISIEQLSDEYYLSCDSIKKIVYSKKEGFIMEYKCTLSSSQNYAKKGKLEEWLHTYLLSDGHNKGFSDGLKLFDRYFLGPIKMPLSLFSRCCGPEAYMKYRVNADWFEQHVTKLESVIQSEKDMPPLIVHFVDGQFELNDGNHRFEAYSRLGVKEYYVIVWITEKHEYDLFLSKYSEYLA